MRTAHKPRMKLKPGHSQVGSASLLALHGWGKKDYGRTRPRTTDHWILTT